jgi:hypothetical protein
MIAEGTYNAVVVQQDTDEGPMSVVLGYASTGTPQAAVAVKITDGPEAGRVRTWLGYFTPDSLDMNLDQLRNAGFTGNDLSEFCTQKPTAPVPIRIVHEKGQDGKIRERLWFNKQGNGFKMNKTMNADQRKLFSAGLTAKLAAKPSQSAPAPKTVDPQI